MTDFIHEAPKPAQPPEPEQMTEETPLDEKSGQKRVYGYIFLLFIVAFSLLLWSFLMNQRSNEQVISELRGSANTLQSTLDRNLDLQKQTEALEARVAELEKQVQKLEKEKTSLQDQLRQRTETERQLLDESQELEAVRAVYYAEILSAQGDHAAAAAVLTSWEPGVLPEMLNRWDADSAHSSAPGSDPEPARGRYDRLVENLTALGYLQAGENGALTVAVPAE